MGNVIVSTAPGSGGEDPSVPKPGNQSRKRTLRVPYLLSNAEPRLVRDVHSHRPYGCAGRRPGRAAIVTGKLFKEDSIGGDDVEALARACGRGLPLRQPRHGEWQIRAFRGPALRKK